MKAVEMYKTYIEFAKILKGIAKESEGKEPSDVLYAMLEAVYETGKGFLSLSGNYSEMAFTDRIDLFTNEDDLSGSRRDCLSIQLTCECFPETSAGTHVARAQPLEECIDKHIALWRTKLYKLREQSHMTGEMLNEYDKLQEKWERLQDEIALFETKWSDTLRRIYRLEPVI